MPYCRLLDIWPSSGLVSLVPGYPHQPSSRISRDVPAAHWSCVAPEASFANGRLNVLTLRLLGSLGVRHEVAGALSALEANYPWEEVVVCRWELRDALLAESPRHTHVQQGLHHPGL